ncbi:ATP-binding protein [Neobacillus sp. SM06]|uniref:sensor histidine kinase n=1 Tax=Neobacillus sp. SM06 TaxID=3422492 RepID=UPI003D2E121C
MKSIFQKLLTYYLGATLIGFILFAFVINYFLHDFLFQKKEDALFQKAEQLTTLIEQSGDPSKDTFYKATVLNNKKIENIKMHLFLLDEDRPNNLANFKKNLLRKSDAFDPTIVNQVLSGKKVKQIGQLQKAADKALIMAGVPVKENGAVVGALFLTTPVKEIPTDQVSKLILFAFFIIAIPAIAVLYWISRRISKPLIVMNQSAHLIGEGQFQQRIKATGKDEVGQLAVTFNQMAEQLEKLEKMRKDLIMNVSHELRTPLTSVRGFIQGMLEGVIPFDQQERYLQICYSEIARLSKLLNTMLDLSAIETGKVKLQHTTVSVVPIIEKVASTIQPRLEVKQISFRMEVQGLKTAAIWGDAERIQQIFFNLLDNAIRHTPIGGLISVCVKSSEETVEVRIADTGSGIHPDHLPHIWEQFYTEDVSRQSHRERSGLGLTITKQLVERMDGKITVESNIGKGTSFTLLFPLLQDCQSKS